MVLSLAAGEAARLHAPPSVPSAGAGVGAQVPAAVWDEQVRPEPQGTAASKKKFDMQSSRLKGRKKETKYTYLGIMVMVKRKNMKLGKIGI